jgi:hypothetical protein
MQVMDLGNKHLKEASRTQEKTQDIKDEIYKRSCTAEFFERRTVRSMVARRSSDQEDAKIRTSRPGAETSARRSGEARRMI